MDGRGRGKRRGRQKGRRRGCSERLDGMGSEEPEIGEEGESQEKRQGRRGEIRKVGGEERKRGEETCVEHWPTL